jgi:glutamate racemase
MMNNDSMESPIGVFDSGYGGLTILREIQKLLPQYDYLYLGDNARAPYGTRSFDIVYRFTLQAVEELFARGCRLVILACNTASAKALRSIQQKDLPHIDPTRRVLGVIRPTVEAIGAMSKTGHVGLFATPGTVRSESYTMEVAKLYPDMHLTGHACPMWVPLVENNEAHLPGADYFVNKDVAKLMGDDPAIDTVILGCTHYPILFPKIREALPKDVQLIAQGEIVAKSLADYLQRHPEMEQTISRTGHSEYLTTERADSFAQMASVFLHTPVEATQITLS